MKKIEFNLYDNDQLRIGWSFFNVDKNANNILIIYTMDGQELNSLNISSKPLYKTLCEMGLKNFIVVGLSSDKSVENRVLEYAPYEININHKNKLLAGKQGKGKIFARQFVEKFIPHFEKNNVPKGTNIKRIVFGCSSGGLMVLYFARAYFNFFDGFIAMSPAIFECGKQLLNNFEQALKIGKLYFDVGTHEPNNNLDADNYYLYWHSELDKILSKKKSDYKSVIIQDGKHNSEHWNLRVPDAIKWVLNY